MGAKDLLLSKTTWGYLLPIIYIGLNKLGYSTPADLSPYIDAIVGVVSGIIFLWGQFARKTTINSVAGIQVKANG